MPIDNSVAVHSSFPSRQPRITGRTSQHGSVAGQGKRLDAVDVVINGLSDEHKFQLLLKLIGSIKPKLCLFGDFETYKLSIINSCRNYVNVAESLRSDVYQGLSLLSFDPQEQLAFVTQFIEGLSVEPALVSATETDSILPASHQRPILEVGGGEELSEVDSNSVTTSSSTDSLPQSMSALSASPAPLSSVSHTSSETTDKQSATSSSPTPGRARTGLFCCFRRKRALEIDGPYLPQPGR